MNIEEGEFENLQEGADDVTLVPESITGNDMLDQEIKVYNALQTDDEPNMPPRQLALRGRPNQRVKNDKIFDNEWNKVEIDLGSSVTIDDNFAGKYFATDLDYTDFKQINEDIYDFIAENESLKFLLEKDEESKLPKIVRKESHAYFLTIREYLLIKNKYTEVFIFTSVADFLGSNYGILYDKLPSKIKESLIRELDGKYDILKKHGIKKLF